MSEEQMAVSTTDLHLAAWLMCQEGAQAEDIEVKFVRARQDAKPRPRSTFIINVGACIRGRDALLQLYRRGEAIVNLKQYEQERKALLDDMFTAQEAFVAQNQIGD